MTKKIRELLNGKNNITSGLLVLLVISLIVLGCTCNEKDGFNFGSDNTETSEKSEDAKDDVKEEEKEEDASFKADEDEVPTRSQSRALVKTTLMNFNEAVQSGDFTEFHTTIARSWRRTSKPSDFEKGFNEFIEKKIDISRIRGEQPEFDPEPNIDKKYGKKVLFLKGTYKTEPLPVNFNLEYIVDDDAWKLVFIGVDTRNN